MVSESRAIRNSRRRTTVYTRELDTHVYVEAAESGLDYDSYVLCHELATLNAEDFRRHLGDISVPTLIRVELAIRALITLGEA